MTKGILFDSIVTRTNDMKLRSNAYLADRIDIFALEIFCTMIH